MTYAVLPAADEITQELGCTDVQSEWIAPWCPSDRYHSGVDLGSTRGGWAIYKSPVYATRRGVVVEIGEPLGLGDQAVCLELDEGGWLWYGHLEAALVTLGEHVEIDQDIGLLGTRGASTAPHLHLEYRTDGPARNVSRQAAGVGNPAPFLYAASQMDAETTAAIQHLQQQIDGILGEFNAPQGRIPKLEAAVKAAPAGASEPHTHPLTGNTGENVP